MEQLINENDYYKTPDLCLSASLYCYGYVIDCIEKSPKNDNVIFYFKRDEMLDEIIKNYHSKKLIVEPQTFFYNLRSIKSRIREN